MTKRNQGKKSAAARATAKRHADANKGKRQAARLAKDLPMLAEKILKGDFAKERLFGDPPYEIDQIMDHKLWDPIFKKRQELEKRRADLQGKKSADPIAQIKADATAKDYPQLARAFNTRAFYKLNKAVRKLTVPSTHNPDTQQEDDPSSVPTPSSNDKSAGK